MGHKSQAPGDRLAPAPLPPARAEAEATRLPASV
jgi:hypothetical protein